MTYGEIYDEIMLKAFPGSAPPENMPAYIRRKIKACQRMINRDYNFWFTIVNSTITTIANQRSYVLPILPMFKEMENAYFTVNLQSYATAPLRQIGIDQHITYGYVQDSSAVEYPTAFRIDGINLELYPLPSEARTLNLFYWSFLPSVDITDVVVFNAYTDAISEYCCEAIIFYIMADIKLDQNEWQASQMYKQEYLQAIEGARFEDTVRRQIPENEVNGEGIGNTQQYNL